MLFLLYSKLKLLNRIILEEAKNEKKNRTRCFQPNINNKRVFKKVWYIMPISFLSSLISNFLHSSLFQWIDEFLQYLIIQLVNFIIEWPGNIYTLLDGIINI